MIVRTTNSQWWWWWWWQCSRARNWKGKLVASSVSSQFCDSHRPFSRKSCYLGRVCDRTGRSVEPCVQRRWGYMRVDESDQTRMTLTHSHTRSQRLPALFFYNACIWNVRFGELSTHACLACLQHPCFPCSSPCGSDVGGCLPWSWSVWPGGPAAAG